MTFSAKRAVFECFKEIVNAMEDGGHLTRDGLVRIVRTAYGMNPAGKGKERKRTLEEVLERILRGHTSDVRVERMKIWSDLHGDMQQMTKRVVDSDVKSEERKA